MRALVTTIVIGLVSATVGFSQGAEPPVPTGSEETDRPLAERLEKTVRARVDAGKVSPVEATRAGIEVGKARAQVARAEHERNAARTLLAA